MRSIFTIPLACALFLSSRLVLAQGDGENAHDDEAASKAEKDKTLALSLDLVLGFGKTPFLGQRPPGAFGTLPTNFVEPRRVLSRSFVLGGDVAVAKHLSIGMNVPFVIATFAPNSTGVTALGNLQLAAEYERPLTKHTELHFELGLAFPTSMGDAPPSEAELAADPTHAPDLNRVHRFAANQAASASRGFEDTALFESNRLGVTPKVSLEIESGKLRIQPYMKIQNLIGTKANLDHTFIGELVLGGRLAYAVSPRVDLGVRAWANVVITGLDRGAVAVAEPELRAHFGAVTPMVGIILPFVGPLTDPYFAGVRLGVAAQF